MYLSMKLRSAPMVEIMGKEFPLKLPNGCSGVVLVFETESQAMEYDPRAALVECQLGRRNGENNER